MLEKPDMEEGQLTACLDREYGIHAVEVCFLPLGVDQDAAAYRVTTSSGEHFFAKLRRGAENDVDLLVPRLLQGRGVPRIIAPLQGTRGELCAALGPFRLTLYPFVQGTSGREIPMSDRHWRELGETIKAVHATEVPEGLREGIRRETWSPEWRTQVRERLRDDNPASDKLSGELLAFLRRKRREIEALLERTETLALELRASPERPVLCHADLHASNVLIADSGELYVVDWDAPAIAPRELDLALVGGGFGSAGRTAEEEQKLFYEGYGDERPRPAALAYYRYERIVEDIAVFACEILGSTVRQADRERALRFLCSSFDPGGSIEMARSVDPTGRMPLSGRPTAEEGAR